MNLLVLFFKKNRRDTVLKRNNVSGGKNYSNAPTIDKGSMSEPRPALYADGSGSIPKDPRAVKTATPGAYYGSRQNFDSIAYMAAVTGGAKPLHKLAPQRHKPDIIDQKNNGRRRDGVVSVDLH